jgi:lipopolysaccharide biosynthesis regulator YciM
MIATAVPRVIVVRPVAPVYSRRSSISTARRLEYAQGFLELGLLDDAEEELAEIPESDRGKSEVLAVRMDYYSQRKDWPRAAATAEAYTALEPEEPHGWISWAYAVRRSKTIVEAEKILLRAQRKVGSTCALLHYNLACYRCQQDDDVGALTYLAMAFHLDPQWKKAALSDPDLARLKGRIEKVN